MKLLITAMGQRGDGIAATADGPRHIARTLPGELVEIDGSRLISIITASPQRVEAFCPHYDRCGGCTLQHWQETAYGAWKRGLVVAALAARHITTEVAPLIDAHGQGRRRVTLHVRQKSGRWVAGFMEQKSHELCALSHCPVLVPALKDAPAIAASFGAILGPCDVAITAADNGLDIAIKAERQAVRNRMAALSGLFHAGKILRLAVNGEIVGVLTAPLVQMGKAAVALPLQPFLQATTRGEEILSHLVLAGLAKSKRVADLFCGIGPFAFRIAEKAKVHAVDSDGPAIAALQSAVRNASGLKPITAEVRDLFKAPLIVTELSEFDAVVFDPPRAGAEAQARMIAKSTVKRVIAVSCDVQSLARDAQILLAGGYQLTSVTPVDQFKWTVHVEVVAVFERLQG